MYTCKVELYSDSYSEKEYCNETYIKKYYIKKNEVGVFYTVWKSFQLWLPLLSDIYPHISSIQDLSELNPPLKIPNRSLEKTDLVRKFLNLLFALK